MPKFKLREKYLYKRAKDARINLDCDPDDPVLKLKAHDARVRYWQHCYRHKLEPRDI